MPEADPYEHWSQFDRLQMLAFDAELRHAPRSLIDALWLAIDRLGVTGRQPQLEYRHGLTHNDSNPADGSDHSDHPAASV